ncbi:hypothetical protein BZA05DRAFT_177923 [Tricharina praecox]|uniref:uncharacterized protein n=1 Tax=Tricharina praecox TaxID=43433 RepID=UPI00221F7B20|nr:uncharacterized protein BZA05DRAFT_177923 [Tricharina praecox]KAI5844195.1 hypothetical protein BZA05DRAFT_177923 [Tricharina praecox]
MVDYAAPSYQFPARNLRPQPHGGASGPRTMSMNLTYLAPQNAYRTDNSSQSHSHHLRRTSSSGIYSAQQQASHEAYHPHQQQPQQNYQPYPPQQNLYTPMPIHKHRSSTASTGTVRSSASSTQLGRSCSNNTTNSIPGPSSNNYVAALRRQKATVWCDKSQQEDPRLVASQKAAKARAAKDVVGPSSSASKGGLGSSSSSSTSLRGRASAHHKLGKTNSHTVVGIGANSLVNQPPPRLSATEANDDSGEEDELYMGQHRRSGSGSGRSSLNSNHRTYANDRRNSSIGGIHRTTSTGSGSSTYSPNLSSTELNEPSSQPRAGKTNRTPPHFVPYIVEESNPRVTISGGGYYETSFPASPVDRNVVRRSGSQLRRSGSVDEGEVRTMTMSGLRLVVANPD